MSETAITNRTLKHLAATFGGHWWKTHGSRFSRGYPDIMGVVDGQFYGIEMKTPQRRDEVSELQQVRLDQLMGAGAICGVATSPDEAEAIVRGGPLS